MNYIELINYFWRLDEVWQFSGHETRLYFYLLKVANGSGWENSWTHSDVRTSANVGVSLNTLKTARNRLIQAGLIDCKPGGKGHGSKTRYRLSTPNLTRKDVRYQNLTPNPHPNLIPNPEPNLAPKPTPLNKLNQTKPISVFEIKIAPEKNPDSTGEREPDTPTVEDGKKPSPPVPGAPPSDSEFDPVEVLRDRLRAQGETYAWHVKNAMSGIQTIALDEVWKWLDRFVTELKAKGETAKTPRDFQSHFVSWLKSELRKSKSYGNHERFAAGGGFKANSGRMEIDGADYSGEF